MYLSFSASYVALWAIVIFQGLLVLALLKQVAALRASAEPRAFQSEEGLPLGSLAPDFAALDERSRREVSIENLAGRTGILLFLSGQCRVCKSLIDSLRAETDLPPTIAVCVQDDSLNDSFEERFGSNVLVLLDAAAEIAAKYRVSSFPTAVIVDGKQKIRGYGNPIDKQDLKRLLSVSLDNSADVDTRESLTISLSGSS